MSNKPQTQIQIIRDFIAGATDGRSGSGGNLSIKGDQLIHYQTVIAERCGERIILNYSRYSLVTGKIQKTIKELVPEGKLIIVGKIAINYMGQLSEKVEWKEGLYNDKCSL